MIFAPLFVAAALAQVAQTFNVEPRLAVVKEGPPNSYFGFSVALFKHDDSTHPELLVGAPLDGAGGTLWRCPFSGRRDDCVRLQGIDPDSGDDQWLGAVVRASGGRAMVCAPRYVKRESGGQRWGHGKCFTLDQRLRHSATWDPCEGREKNR